MFILMLFAPVVLAALVMFWQNRFVIRLSLLAAAALYLLAAFGWGFDFIHKEVDGWLSNYFQIDAIGLFFLTIMALVFAGTAIYSLFFFKETGTGVPQEARYVASMLLFVDAMAGVILASHLGLLWVFVEATTLTSAVLIYFEKKKSSLEAAWKYVFICSVGIAMAFVGIIILSMGSRSIGTLFFTDLYQRAYEINPFWLKMAFAFILVGFGTKVGIAPIHAWLPDAHSEAPSPVSALLSGTLLNTAFLGLIRVQEIMIQARLDSFSNLLLLITGFLSLLISAVFMLGTVNYKRMLAYSSIENMGILFIGIAMGKTGIYAAMLHTVAHSLSKSSLFLTSGNILHLYGSKKISDVKGLLHREPLTGWLWIVSLLAIIGLPPFPSFLSKFLLITAFFEAGQGWLAVPFFLFVAVIIYGMGGAIFRMSFGDLPPGTCLSPKLGLSAYIPQVVFLLGLAAIGIYIPERALAFIQSAAGFLK
ncbi:MAG: proton-conducting transporter membrane subunit [Candidatus Latescibacterota bacterium]